mmetsp:Transcript_45039/g.74988  ORF Transcript_45039/g.74988 Transcript_45039/m.74988 type:complete len:82 (+) Transcript_45039:48-293(+)
MLLSSRCHMLVDNTLVKMLEPWLSAVAVRQQKMLRFDNAQAVRVLCLRTTSRAGSPAKPLHPKASTTSSASGTPLAPNGWQ